MSTAEEPELAIGDLPPEMLVHILSGLPSSAAMAVC